MDEGVVELVEDIAGGGCHVAAYAMAQDPNGSGCVAYFKVFTEPVTGYFSPGHCILKGAARNVPDSPLEAARAAMAQGRKELDELLMAPDEEVAWVALQYR